MLSMNYIFEVAIHDASAYLKWTPTLKRGLDLAWELVISSTSLSQFEWYQDKNLAVHSQRNLSGSCWTILSLLGWQIFAFKNNLLISWRKSAFISCYPLKITSTGWSGFSDLVFRGRCGFSDLKWSHQPSCTINSATLFSDLEIKSPM